MECPAGSLITAAYILSVAYASRMMCTKSVCWLNTCTHRFTPRAHDSNAVGLSSDGVGLTSSLYNVGNPDVIFAASKSCSSCLFSLHWLRRCSRVAATCSAWKGISPFLISSTLAVGTSSRSLSSHTSALTYSST